MKTKIVSSHTADSKPVKQEVNGTVILPSLVFPAKTALGYSRSRNHKHHHSWKKLYNTDTTAAIN